MKLGKRCSDCLPLTLRAGEPNRCDAADIDTDTNAANTNATDSNTSTVTDTETYMEPRVRVPTSDNNF